MRKNLEEVNKETHLKKVGFLINMKFQIMKIAGYYERKQQCTKYILRDPTAMETWLLM